MIPAKEPLPVAKTNLKGRFILSVKVVAGAWLIFNLVLFCWALFQAIFNPHAWVNSQNPFSAPILIAVGSAIVVFLTWLGLALPLALFVPYRSAFWQPGMLILIGIVTANVLMWLNLIYDIRSNSTFTINDVNTFYLGDVVLPTIPCTLIGALAGAIASHLHKRLRAG